MGTLFRRWAPLVFLLPLTYLLAPLFWTTLDHRFFNFFASKRPDPQWRGVAVVEIDEATCDSVFEPPLYPLSRHSRDHARLVRAIDAAGARAIVLDMGLGEGVFASEPTVLERAIEAAGDVYLVMSLVAPRESGGIQATTPHPALVSASRGAFVADVRIDNDGVLRRVYPNDAASRLGLSTLYEELSGRTLDRPVPIEFPSVDSPIPAVSYADVLADSARAREVLAGRIVFVGSVLDASTDHVVVPRRQRSGETESFLLPGVKALAAITATLSREHPMRDAGWPLVLAWNLLWSLLAVVVMPQRKPVLSVALLAAVTAAALAATGLLHAHAGLVFPAGLLLGCLLVCGGYTLVDTYVQTTRELYAVLKQSHDELEAKVRERTAELANALETVKATQAQLVQSEKMASLGNLVAGIAHEINNPVGAVSGALDVSRRCIEKIEGAAAGSELAGSESFAKPLGIMKESTASAATASQRIAVIVRSLKNFARLDEAEIQEADIHEGIESTLTLLDHEAEGRVRFVRDFGDVPRVRCYVRELNQVFMNLIRNAIQAIDGDGTVTLTTRSDGGRVRVSVSDTGTGIADDVLSRIFDPGFTTRGVGVGTGLGLSISYNIVHKHGGEIRVDSAAPGATTVTIEIPLSTPTSHSGEL